MAENVSVRIRGAVVHLPYGQAEADILITGERVAGIVDPDTEARAEAELDATGLEVMPGLVDLHAHARTPGLEYKEDFSTLSAAAAVGGITTYVDMPNVEPPTDSLELLMAKRDMAAKASLVDWGHFVSGSKPERVGELAAAGATGFKIFMVGGGYPHDDRIAVVANDVLYAALEGIGRTGLPCLVHPFEQGLFNMFWRRALDAGKAPDHRTRVEVYTGIDIIWRNAVSTLLQFAEETNVRLHVLHTHAVGSIRLVREAKAKGAIVTAALDPKYFHLTREDLERLGPRAYSGAVITEDPEHLAAIWSALRDGTIDTIDSDHGPHTLEEVDRARVDASKAELGSPQYDNLLQLLLNDVAEGNLAMPDIVRLACENPARIIGRFPQKGAITVGSDADLVLVDRMRRVTIKDADVKTKVGWTPYAGWTVTGTPVMTFHRGRLVAREGEVLEGPGRAQYLAGRPLAPMARRYQRSPGLFLEATAGSPVT